MRRLPRSQLVMRDLCLCWVQIAQTSHAKYGELEKLYPAVSAVTPKAGELADGVHVRRAGRAHSIELYPLSHHGLTGDAWRRQVLWAAVWYIGMTS